MTELFMNISLWPVTAVETRRQDFVGALGKFIKDPIPNILQR